MSDFTALSVLFALAIACMWFFFFITKLIRHRADVIVTGVVQGVPISTKSRRLLVYSSWVEAIGAGIGWQSIQSIMWFLIGQNVGAEPVRLFAYMCAFFALMPVLDWIAQAVLWYPHLRSVLRQAEAD